MARLARQHLVNELRADRAANGVLLDHDLVTAEVEHDLAIIGPLALLSCAEITILTRDRSWGLLKVVWRTTMVQ